MIGAGIAGLAAARELEDGGMRVHLFDKGSRPGGRMSTKTTDHGAFDLGAQYFSVRDDDFATLIDAAQRDGAVTAWPQCMARLDDSGWQQRKPHHPRYCGAPSMDALPRYLAQGLAISSGQQIESLVRDDECWTLLSRQGERYQGFDQLVLAVPGPQAQALVAAHLPAAALPARCTAMTPCWSTWLHLEAPLDDRFWQGLTLDASPVLRWVARNQGRNGAAPDHDSGERLSLLARADWSAINLERERDDIATAMTAALADGLAGTLPNVKACGAHRWRYAQPYCAHQSEAGYHHFAEQQLTFCGDWCLDGRVEAAWLSGRRAARHLLEHIADRSH